MSYINFADRGCKALAVICRAITILSLSSISLVAAQTPLSPCPPNGYWDNCSGSWNHANGANYVGEYRGGKWDGGGVYINEKGDKYVGEFKNGDSHGFGTWTSRDGVVYVGQFKEGSADGMGTLTLPNGEKHVGEFRRGKQHGLGTWTSPAGEEYSGLFISGKRAGQGIYRNTQNRAYQEGIWENDNFMYDYQVSDYIRNRGWAISVVPSAQETKGATPSREPLASKTPIDLAKGKCTELGLILGTEKFGECVLRLSK